MVQGNRSFIVNKKQVVKGGNQKTYPIGGGVREEIELAPGKEIYTITDEGYEILKDFSDITIVEHLKEGKKK
jgi:hypothetical protein